MTDSRVLCIGLDAACFEQLSPLIEAGELEHLPALFDRGTAGTLTTTTPPWTPSAWQSITTGTTPWTHGIYDFYDYTGTAPHLVSATDLQVPYLWEYLDAAGHKSIVVNVPVTHPVHQISGSIVPGYLAPESAEVLIDGEVSDQSTLNDTYRIYARDRTDRTARIDENERLIRSRVAAAETLAGRHDWSFMMVQFQRTDSIFHTMGHDEEAVRRVYQTVDEAVGTLLELVGDETTVLVVSDHGIHEYDGIFRCNTWLRDRGWVQTSGDAERYSWGETTKPTATDETGSTAVSHRLVGAGLSVFQRLGLTPQRTERALRFVGLADPVRKRLPDELLIDSMAHVDWGASQAYCRSVSSLGIRCNVEGREPDGVVPSADFDGVRTQLIEALRAVRGPDGTAVFEDVYDRHERHGSDVANEASAPDIVVCPTEMRWKVTDVVREPMFDATTEFSHTYDGLFAAAGPSIVTDAPGNVHATDIAPTILALFGHRPAPVMEGEVPAELLSVNEASLHPAPTPGARYYPSDTDTEPSAAVTDRLSEMGYLE
ncbi:alkaline phosphatase family protein [Haloarcula laminariae]|uniref:alkaline phosphatase family protein n=1 Tax=Haloarcula laminariae TaxID=2961577 RepID=UPI0021C69ACF|nr:alkaline phosphatase family protein [Halomicroarcula laminariae]